MSINLSIDISFADSQYYKARNNFYGFGNGTIWLDYVYCSGSESNLLSCSRAYDIGVYYCSYTYMAGVYCHRKFIKHIMH